MRGLHGSPPAPSRSQPLRSPRGRGPRRETDSGGAGRKPNSVRRRHPPRRGRRTVIHLGRPSPAGSSTLPAALGRPRRTDARDGPPLAAYAGLLAVGFTLPRLSPAARCALTAPFHPYRAMPGGVFSVALSLGLRRVGVTNHRALPSSDFPPVNAKTRKRATASPAPPHEDYTTPAGEKPRQRRYPS